MTAWTLHLDESVEIIVEVTINAPPKSKSRPRFGKGGRVYTDRKTREAEEFVGWHVAAEWSGGPDSDATFGLRCLFHVGSYQRQDVDNMLKLAADACTGIVWDDDSQVVEVSGRVVRGSDEPRTEILIYNADTPKPPSDTCNICGDRFRVYPSRPDRKYCSRECTAKGQTERLEVHCANQSCGEVFRLPNSKLNKERPGKNYCSQSCYSISTTVEFTCAACGETQRRPKSVVRRNPSGRNYCDNDCRAQWWRTHRVKNPKGTCEVCGGGTSKKKYLRCQACALSAMAGRDRDEEGKYVDM